MQTRNFFLGGILGSLLGFTGFGLPSGSALAQDVPCQTTPARDLTPEQAASLEEKLEHDPHDLASRTRLLRLLQVLGKGKGQVGKMVGSGPSGLGARFRWKPVLLSQSCDRGTLQVSFRR